MIPSSHTTSTASNPNAQLNKLAAGLPITRSLTSGTSGLGSSSSGFKVPGAQVNEVPSMLGSVMPPELETAPTLLAASEMHYTETFNRQNQGLDNK